jgi:hypothetical protein
MEETSSEIMHVAAKMLYKEWLTTASGLGGWLITLIGKKKERTYYELLDRASNFVGFSFKNEEVETGCMKHA